MRTRNNKLINFILEISQVLLVFLGVYSAIMCAATSLELTFDRGLLFLIMFVSSIVFYGLFTVLETFRKGKLYGLLSITLFFLLIAFRFLGAMKKGFVTIINSFLKEFMNYTGTSLNLLSYTDLESSSVKFCTNLVLIIVGIYLIAFISAFFYRRRHSKVFLLGTAPFVILPLVVGRLGYFSNFFTYLIVAITIIGTRHLKTDATDRRMRQKLAIILMIVGLVCGSVSYALVPPDYYYGHMDKLTQAKNSLVSLSSWDGEDVFTWLKAYFNDDAITYGRIGKKKEINYTGETMLKISGDFNSEHGLYLKGYVGDVYEDNKWSSLASEEQYEKDRKSLDDNGVTIDNWHAQLRNELGDNETSGDDNIWQTGELRIRNLAFGYGNYVVPYLPTASFKSENNGRSTVEKPGIDYNVEYYLKYPHFLRQDILQHNYRMANGPFWEGNKVERKQLTDFAKKYYLSTPESLSGVCENFKTYLEKQGNLLKNYQSGLVSDADMIQAVKNYITKDTEYTLSPGKTPSGKDTVEYFLQENKKGYCTYYATSAAVLLRSIGIPTRYVEGMYVTKEELAEGVKGEKEIEILDENAHAWIEVYDEKYGFVPVEVTPGRGEDDMQNSDTSNQNNSQNSSANSNNQQNNQPEEQPEIATPTPSVTETPEESMTFEDIEGNEDNSPEGGLGKSETSTAAKIWAVVWKVFVIILLIIVALEIQRRIRKQIFTRNMRSFKAKRRIRMAHHHLMPVFAERSVVYRGQSMAKYARELAEALAMPEEEMVAFVALIFHARFGPDTISEEELQAFGKTYQRICRKVYDDVKWIKKLYYLYIMVL